MTKRRKTLRKSELIALLRETQEFADIPDGADIYAVAPGGRPPHLELRISWDAPDDEAPEEEA